MAVATRQEPAAATYRAVFAVGEFRALWAAQVISFAGDQFARVALALLVYNRTGSPALAALTWAAGAGAQFAGGLLLGWVADRWPRRAVMIACDLACAGLVAVMIVPGVPLPVLVGLLFAVALAVEPFLAARMATNRAALAGPVPPRQRHHDLHLPGRAARRVRRRRRGRRDRRHPGRPRH